MITEGTLFMSALQVCWNHLLHFYKALILSNHFWFKPYEACISSVWLLHCITTQGSRVKPRVKRFITKDNTSRLNTEPKTLQLKVVSFLHTPRHPCLVWSCSGPDWWGEQGEGGGRRRAPWGLRSTSAPPQWSTCTRSKHLGTDSDTIVCRQCGRHI